MNKYYKAKNLKLSQAEKINILRKIGQSCFEYEFDFKSNIKDFLKKENAKSVAGRIIKFDAKNFTGIIADSSSKVNFKLKMNKKNRDVVEFIDEGDIVGLKGELTASKNIVTCSKITILTKTYLPLDQEIKNLNHYGLRHLEYIINDDAREKIKTRIKVLSLLRKYLMKNGFVEIDTPLLHPFQGDSIAKPLFVDVTSCNMRFALASSPELYLKKMLVGGFNKVFTINRSFRDESVDDTHLIEFLSVEYYMAYVDYMYMMKFTEKILKYMVRKINETSVVMFRGNKLDFGKKWERVSIHKSLKKLFKKDLFILNEDELLEIAKTQGIFYSKAVSSGNIIIDIFNKCIGDSIIQPTFVYDYPKDATVMCYDITMAKEKRSNRRILERFELYMGGMELANCYSELTDPEQQKSSFEKFLLGRNKTLKMDPNFYHALQIGMPPASGVGFGIDRLLMILTNSDKIYETVTFSTYHEKI